MVLKHKTRSFFPDFNIPYNCEYALNSKVIKSTKTAIQWY